MEQAQVRRHMENFRDWEEDPKQEKDKIFDKFRNGNNEGVKRAVSKAPFE